MPLLHPNVNPTSPLMTKGRYVRFIPDQRQSAPSCNELGSIPCPALQVDMRPAASGLLNLGHVRCTELRMVRAVAANWGEAFTYR